MLWHQKTLLRFWLTVFWRQKIHTGNCILAQQHEKVNTSRCRSPTDFPFSNYCSPACKVSHRCCAFWTADLQLLLSGNKGHIRSVLTGEVQYNTTQESLKIGCWPAPNCSVICASLHLTAHPRCWEKWIFCQFPTIWAIQLSDTYWKGTEKKKTYPDKNNHSLLSLCQIKTVFQISGTGFSSLK